MINTVTSLSSTLQPAVARPPRYWTLLICLALLISLLILERLHTYNEVIERDIAGYAVIAHEMLKGRALYSDLWERKPPLLYATFAAAQWLCGYGPREIFFLNVLAGTATLLALYSAGKAGNSGRAGGLFAAAIWVLIGGDLYTQANQPNAEVFVNVCLTAAFALLVHWPARRQMTAAIFLGVLFTFATLYKQHVVVTCAALSVAHVLSSFSASKEKRHQQIKSRLMHIAIAGGVVASAWMTIAAYFCAVGRFSAFADTLLLQNVSYAGPMGPNIAKGFLPANIFPSFAPWAMILCGLILAWTLLNLRRLQTLSSIPPHVICWFAWAIGSIIACALPGKFFPHYYQLLMPVWCTAGGWVAARLLKETRPHVRLLHRLALAGALGGLIGCQIGQYFLSPEIWSQQKYPLENFPEQKRMGLQLAQMLSPNETFYDLGQDNTLYFYSNRSPATGLLYFAPIEEGTAAGKYEDRLITDLQRSKPRLILMPQPPYIAMRRPWKLSAWLKENYQPSHIDSGSQMFQILMRKSSSQEMRYASSN